MTIIIDDASDFKHYILNLLQYKKSLTLNMED